MTKSVKAVVIASAALLVLGAALLVLLLTKPKPDDANSGPSGANSGITDGKYAYIIDKKADTVTSIKVKNADGAFTFTRQKRVVSSTNESGTVTSKDEYYWTSSDLKGVPQSDITVRNFIAGLSSMFENSRVEDHPNDLDKYGLADPQSTALLEFDDGTSIKMLFGIQNPADSGSIYFKTADSDAVSLVNYYAASPTLSDVRQFAELTMTDSYDTEGSNNLKSLKVTRFDLEEPVEIRYMSELEGLASEEDIVVSTFNTHRFVSPVTAEVDVTKGQDVCYKIYGLQMSACEYLEQTEENMKICGLDDPHTKVEFSFGGKEYELLMGGTIREEIEGAFASDGTPITTVTGFYAVMKGVPGIYSIDRANAPWATFSVSGIISRRPLSPYIYSANSIEVTVPDGKFKFDIDGENKEFFYEGKQLLSQEFRNFYQFLIAAVGEEVYSGEVSGEPYTSVTFTYNSRYYDVYGTHSDTISYYESDDRKCIVVLNGEPIFKVRRTYADRLVANVDALINGGEVNFTW